MNAGVVLEDLAHRLLNIPDEVDLSCIALCALPTSSIHTGVPDDDENGALASAAREILHRMKAAEISSMFDHPARLRLATMPPSQRSMYDSMDNHQGFGNTSV